MFAGGGPAGRRNARCLRECEFLVPAVGRFAALIERQLMRSWKYSGITAKAQRCGLPILHTHAVILHLACNFISQ